MAYIRPSADLRNKYNEISRICHKTKEPIYITKNGANDLVILSNEAYEELEKERKESEEARIDRLISKKFDQHYANFEGFQKDILKKVDEALKEIEEGKGIPMESIVAEMEEKYHFDEEI